MAQQKDAQGNVIDDLDKLNGQTLVDTRPNTAVLGSFNAETIIYCANTNGVAIDIRGTFVATFVGEYSIDGVNFNSLPLFNPNTEVFVAPPSAPGSFLGHLPAGTKMVKIRCSAYTSGSATVAMRGSTGDNLMYAKPIPATSTVTVTAASGAAATLTLPAPGTGLFHYITRILVQRHTSAVLTAGATPVLVTTTNMPGSRVFSIPADAAAQGAVHTEIAEPSQPIKSSASNTATTIVAPTTTGVIWRITVDYYVGQ